MSETKTVPAEACGPRPPSIAAAARRAEWPADYDQAPELNMGGLRTYLRRWQPLIAAKLIATREHWPRGGASH